MTCTSNPGHIFMCKTEHMDAILYFIGGIHFIFDTLEDFFRSFQRVVQDS